MSSSKDQSIPPTLRIIHFALMVSIGIYYGLVQFLKAEWPAEPQVDEQSLMVFSVLGLGACFMGMIANRSFLSPQRLKKLENPIAGIFTGFIISWALFEACTVFGLVYSFTNQDASQFHLFAILSIACMLAHPPSNARVRALLAQ